MTANAANRVFFIVTSDEAGNNQIFAGCQNFEARWTLQAEKACTFRCFDTARMVASQFDGWRIVAADKDLGPRVVIGDDHRFYII